jgi:hypothetical protein
MTEKSRLSAATDKRGGHPGSGDGSTMPPPPPNPSGSPPARDVSDASTWPEGHRLAEDGELTPYDVGQREGFRRALEGEAPWWPIPGNPTGEYRGFNVERPPPEPIHGDLNATYTSTLGRFLDPVRAHALAQAVNHVGVNGVEGDDVPGEVLAIASRFEAWLVGEQESEG